MSAPELGPEAREIWIRQKGPVGWLNLGLLFDTGFLAAISAATDNRTSRREVLAALDLASGDPAVFDYSAPSDGDFWFDYLADLGDGFDATHSVAWLIGRDHIGIGTPGQPTAQPLPPGKRQECAVGDMPGQALPAGRMLILGGDLIYPYASQSEYESRTIGPYHAARPWQRDRAGRSHGRALFAIPGNHDWYDGLGAFVQRFCQPGRWMGCWQAQQRRSYFAIRLPHDVWVWGVDLATADDFDAPQLDYFRACGGQLTDRDTVILCVPKPAWVDRRLQDGQSAEDVKTWQSWNKIDLIAKIVRDRGGEQDGPQIGAILSGDLHHYSRYAVPGHDADETHLITCGGGGAFMIGTAGLPQSVEVGGPQEATLAAAYPDGETSCRLRRQVFRLPLRHWDFATVLGAVMLTLAWYLDSAGPGPILVAGIGDFCAAVAALLASSPVPLLVLAAVFYGFIVFARSGGDDGWRRSLIAGGVHLILQLALALIIAGGVKHWLMPILPDAMLLRIPTLAFVMAAALLLGWAGAGLLFAAYLITANTMLGLHGLEVYSAQSIEDWKSFLRIRVNAAGITIHPIGLNDVCHDWKPLGAKDGPRLPPRRGNALAARVWARFTGAAARLARRQDVFDDDPNATHLYVPETPLSPHLIEKPIFIPHKGTRT